VTSINYEADTITLITSLSLLWMSSPKRSTVICSLAIQRILLLSYALVLGNAVEITFRLYIIYAYLRDIRVVNTTKKK